VTFTASIMGNGVAPTGNVAFQDGGTAISGCATSALASGKATCTTSALASGTHSITGKYSGDSTYAAGTAGPITQTVNGAGGTSTPGAVPAAPTLVSPSGSLSTTTPAYAWNASAGATSYSLVVQNTAGVAVSATYPASSLGCGAGTGTCSVTPTAALANGAMYSWFVKASNGAGVSAWSAGKTVTVSGSGPTPPKAPVQASPSGAATTATPAYAWNASAGATSYYLIVMNTAGVAVSSSYSASALGCGSGTGTCSITPSIALANGSTYNWFVNASNNVGTSGWSNGLTITVSGSGPTVPGAPTLVSPTGTVATTTPTYMWNASPGATRYYLLVQNTHGVAVSLSVTATAAGCATGSTCSYTPGTPLAPATTYSWFVNASNSLGTSAWSAGKTIRTP